MPDSALMPELCEALGISVNELFSGEVLKMEQYNNNAERNLIDLQNQKEKSDRLLLRLELALIIVLVISVVALGAVAAYAALPDWARITLVATALVVLLVVAAVGLKIEQVAGYYECGRCGNRYVPEYKSVVMTMHNGRTRYLKCPKCGKRSWNKKVLTK